MRAFTIWFSYLLGLPFLLITCICIVFTYVFYYPSSFLRNFSDELSQNEYTSYKNAAKRAFSEMGKKDLF